MKLKKAKQVRHKVVLNVEGDDYKELLKQIRKSWDAQLDVRFEDSRIVVEWTDWS